MTADLSNFDKRWLDAHFESFLFHYYCKVPLFFWFDLFLEARADILEKISLFFGEIWRHQKDILKLSDL